MGRSAVAFGEFISAQARDWRPPRTGFAIAADDARKFAVPSDRLAGGALAWEGLGFSSREAWWAWCRGCRIIAAETEFALRDSIDFHNALKGVRDLRHSVGLLAWEKAAADLRYVALRLPGTFALERMLQPICSAAWHSMKAALLQAGVDPGSRELALSSSLAEAAERLGKAVPYRRDDLIIDASRRFPPFARNRYAAVGLTRFEVLRLALAAQFIAAASLRRFGFQNSAAELATRVLRPPLI